MTADSLAIRLTLLLLMPSASTTAMPLRLSSGSSGNQDAVEILVDFLAALVGMLSDRDFQFARHPGIMAKGLSLAG